MTLLQSISPVDGSVYCERPAAEASQIERTLKASHEATASWQKRSLSDRMSMCMKAVEYLVDYAEDIGEEITMQMGRPIKYSRSEIVGGLQERATHMILNAPEYLQEKVIEHSRMRHRFIVREPLGTVLVLAPWNYPWLTSVNVIIPALLAGNSVILKHAEQTMLVAERYAKAFAAAGLPPGVFHYLHLTHDQVAQVIADPRIDHVAFTGSVVGGQAVLAAARNRFIDVGLELGGKDAAYVCEDANLAATLEHLVDGSFFNSGQSCCGVERIYVQESIFDDFVDGFVQKVQTYHLGNPLDPKVTLGPLIRPAAASRMIDQVASAVEAGAATLIDPSLFTAHNPASGYVAPQVLIHVDHRMDVMQEESFAPVVGIMSVKQDAEAIRHMNDSRYGLTSSIWTSDFDRARRIGENLQTGTVFQNRCDYLDPALAWTGVKDSGRGVTLSEIGMQSLTRPKSYYLRKL